MVTQVIKAVAVFVIFLYVKPAIDGWVFIWRFLGYVAGIGYPISVIGDPIMGWLHERMRMRYISKQIRENLRANLRASMQTATGMPGHRSPLDKPPSQPEQVVLDQAQLEQLNLLRSRIALDQAQRFGSISYETPWLPNYVNGAGIFKDKLIRHKKVGATTTPEKFEAVGLFASTDMIKPFEKAYASSKDKACQFSGYLLPSRTGLSYYVFYVTRIFVGGKVIYNPGGQ